MISSVLKADNIHQELNLAEQRVVLHNISWSTYEQILADIGQRRSCLLTYNQGTLEITMPLEDHEYAVRFIEIFIQILLEELNLKFKNMGSTTLKRPDLQKERNQTTVTIFKTNL